MKKVVIWGAGKLGKKVYAPLITKYEMDVIAYVDNCAEKRKEKLYGLPIVDGETVRKLDFDLVLIALYSDRQIMEVRNQCESMGVSADRIVELATDLNYIGIFMHPRYEWIREYAGWLKENAIGGSIAECGVFRGDSAKFLNLFFKDKKLYLFDTFEGFSLQDVKREKEVNNQFETSVFNSKTAFTNTSIDLVLKKMSYPENVVIKQGYFPDSAEGVEEEFCFVNLDMDLYVPMLAGLRFFWDKLKMHGCILLHDYFRNDLLGVRKAVNIFEQERGIIIPKTPIGDGCSMALLKYRTIRST